MSNYIALSYWQLVATSVFVLINPAVSVFFGLRVHRSLLFAAIRIVVQLTLVGLVLTTLFLIASPLWTGLAALVMVLFAGHEAAQRQERRLAGWWSFGLGPAACDDRANPRRRAAIRGCQISDPRDVSDRGRHRPRRGHRGALAASTV